MWCLPHPPAQGLALWKVALSLQVADRLSLLPGPTTVYGLGTFRNTLGLIVDVLHVGMRDAQLSVSKFFFLFTITQSQEAKLISRRDKYVSGGCI